LNLRHHLVEYVLEENLPLANVFDLLRP